MVAARQILLTEHTDGDGKNSGVFVALPHIDPERLSGVSAVSGVP
jgi:hypothetical protein